MATTIWPKYTKTFLRPPTVRAGALDILTTNPSSTLHPRAYTDVDTEQQFEIQVGQPDAGTPIVWYSPRVESTIAIAGEIAFHVGTVVPGAGAGVTARVRVTLTKLSAGGSNIETPICEQTMTSNIPDGLAVNILNVTPSVSVTMEPGERFVYRAWIQPVSGSYVVNTYIEHHTSSVTSISKLVFTETIAFTLNGYSGIMRDTRDTGIGNFRDLGAARSANLWDWVGVPSAAGGGELQFSGTPYPKFVNGLEIASTSNAATYVSAISFTPAANYLYLLAVVHSDAAPESTVPTVTTTTGLTFVQVGSSMPFSTIASPGLRLTLFRAMKSSGLVDGTYTVTLADAGTGCAARLFHVPGVVTTGTDGADAIINVSTNSNNASADPSVTLGAFSDTDNSTILFLGTNTATVPTGGTGMSVIAHSTYSTPTGAVAAAWNPANDTTPDLVLASSAWAAIAVELVAAAGPVEWISPRFAAPGWLFDAEEFVTPLMWFVADATAVAGDNMGAAAKLFRRRPDGTELLVATWTTTTGVPTAGKRIPNDATFVLHQPTSFAEDDRVVVRPYRTPVGGSMAGGHLLELRYDGTTVGSTGDSYMKLWDPSKMKAEADPDADPSALPSRLPLMGA